MALTPSGSSCRQFFVSSRPIAHMLPYGRGLPYLTRHALPCASLCNVVLCFLLFPSSMGMLAVALCLVVNPTFGVPRRFPEIGRLRKKAQWLRQGIKSTMDRLMAGGEFAGMLAVSLCMVATHTAMFSFSNCCFFFFAFPFSCADFSWRFYRDTHCCHALSSPSPGSRRNGLSVPPPRCTPAAAPPKFAARLVQRYYEGP